MLCTDDGHNHADQYHYFYLASPRYVMEHLVAENQPLTEVLAELNRSYKGYLYFDAAQFKGRRINAVLPLDNTEKALSLLMTAMPDIQMQKITPYMMVVRKK